MKNLFRDLGIAIPPNLRDLDTQPTRLLLLTPVAAAGTADPNGFAFDSLWRTKVAMATQQIRTPAGVPQRSAGCSKGSAPPSRRAPAPLTGCGGIFCVQGPSGRLSEWLLTGLLNTRQPASMLV